QRALPIARGPRPAEPGGASSFGSLGVLSGCAFDATRAATRSPLCSESTGFRSAKQQVASALTCPPETSRSVGLHLSETRFVGSRTAVRSTLKCSPPLSSFTRIG